MNLPKPSRSLVLMVAVAGLALPAVASFALHLVEHVTPLGVTRGAHELQLPDPVAFGLVYAAIYCLTTTWCGIVLTVLTFMTSGVSLAAKAFCGSVALMGYVAMRNITAVTTSCFGEAPHLLDWLGGT